MNRAPAAEGGMRDEGRCDKCNRYGFLVCQDAHRATPHLGITKPWVFRYYLCRWHLAAWNRHRSEIQSKMERVAWKPDHELIAALAAHAKAQGGVS